MADFWGCCQNGTVQVKLLILLFGIFGEYLATLFIKISSRTDRDIRFNFQRSLWRLKVQVLKRFEKLKKNMLTPSCVIQIDWHLVVSLTVCCEMIYCYELQTNCIIRKNNLRLVKIFLFVIKWTSPKHRDWNIRITFEHRNERENVIEKWKSWTMAGGVDHEFVSGCWIWF